VPHRAEPRVVVECATCHRGLALPKTLQTTLFETIEAKGVAAAVTQYRELRRDQMTSGTFNFGEWEINELGRRLIEAGRPDAAIAVLEMNAEFYPGSGSIQFQLGELYRERGNRDKALHHYKAALEKMPDHQGARRWVEELSKLPE
jgi:tetratricopeptide (TPR) repeat protein